MSESGEGAIDDNWWRQAVFYQIYPRSFMDSNGDGVGDLRGIISKLSHLAELGITATWLSPIFASPMVDFGYDVSNFTAIQPEYGTMQDFEHFVAEANKLGIKVILDFVPNHTSDQCEWFRKSAARMAGYEDFYVWADGPPIKDSGERKQPNNWQSVFYGSAWTWHPHRGQFYLHQFTAAQPDLNYRCDKVVSAMQAVLLFWLSKGVSGFRVDAVNHLFEAAHLRDEPLSGKTHDARSYDYTEHIYTRDLAESYAMLQDWRRLLDNYTRVKGGHTRILMTEAYTGIKAVMDYYIDARGVAGAQFPFNFALIEEVKADGGNGIDARDIVISIQKWLTYMPRGHVANWVMGNHDKPRLASRLGPELVDTMHMLLMMLPGVAVTYNGEEIGMEDYRDISWEDTVDPLALNVGPHEFKAVSRDPVRTPFQWSSERNAGFSVAEHTWLPVHPDYKQLNLQQQMSDPKSHYNVYKELVALRKLPTLRCGRTDVEALNRYVLALKRTLKDHPVILTIVNVGATQAEVDLSALLAGDVTDATLTVLVSSSSGTHEKGSTTAGTVVRLEAYEGFVCTLN